MAQKISRSGYSHGKKKSSGTWMVIVVLLVISLLSATFFSLLWQKAEDKKREKDRSGSSSSSSSEISSTSESSASEVSSVSSDSSQTASSASSGEDSSESSSESVAYQKAEFGVPVPQQERVKSDYFDNALFVGDSITDGIRSYGVMSNTTVIAYTGVNPETILSKKLINSGNGEKITFLEAMAQHPETKKIYIMMGANGMAWLTKDIFIANYGNFIDQVKAQHPDALIYVQSILPVTKSYEEKNTGITNAAIDEFNQALLALAKEKSVYYLNVAESFKDENGALPEEASSDGMHFATKHYNIWFDYLKEHAVTSN